MKKKLCVLLCLIIACFASFIMFVNKPSSEKEFLLSNTETENENTEDILQTETPSATKAPSSSKKKKKVKIDTDPTSYTVLVNKEYGIPENYVPSDLVVPDITYSFSYYDEKKQLRQVPASALEELVAAAANEGLRINGVSGYRSCARQSAIYKNNIKTQGLAHTEQYSARPGYSEHQTGLSIDVSSSSNGNRLTEAFGNTKEGQWLAENCYKFGFIIRYPKGKESITGYSYEPWHIRYIGVELATHLSKNELTLEEYYKYKPSATVAPTMTAAPSSTPSYFNYDLDATPVVTPKATKQPTYTPRATQKPEVTKSPKPTKTPMVTSTPKVTRSPKPTKAPNVTHSPKPTKTPNVTSSPEVSAAPTAKATPAPSKKPSHSNGALEKPDTDPSTESVSSKE